MRNLGGKSCSGSLIQRISILLLPVFAILNIGYEDGDLLLTDKGLRLRDKFHNKKRAGHGGTNFVSSLIVRLIVILLFVGWTSVSSALMKRKSGIEAASRSTVLPLNTLLNSSLIPFRPSVVIVVTYIRPHVEPVHG